MKMTILKDLKLKDYLPKGIINNYKVIINGKKIMTKQLFRYKTIRRN